ncbi:uncharacterized protein N7459_008410 [Penicillium hispanicum]|uniref:uncharacterized protein n=1 Tax=Penicillium hispanicum TaxID=1080232 RepID=UPI002541A040|nr:uncharacterized protein N7459_008410 [Penicillium hispanicum]KAJ5573983.1 hypothetical protein N7459_008410 [Penicillium hispanicum]
MDYHKCLDYLHQVEEDIWVDLINEARIDGRLCDWVGTLLPEKAPCRLIGGFLNGSYNLCQKFAFSDGAVMLLRLPRASSVASHYADEKVAMEVEALRLIRKNTDIPVPLVHAWGLSDKNMLGLGSFILMEFIDGVCLKEVFTENSRVLKEGVPDYDIERIYRQMSNFMLQLFKIDLPHLGSLPTPVTHFSPPIRPLTWKVHDILQNGGINTFGDRSKGFETTTQYFRYILEQDVQQLQQQPNSVAGKENAVSRYASLQILGSMMPSMIHQQYEQGPFKLICDDLGPANVIVKSRNDLTIVGVVDLEWVYAGPAQLFASAPWWLLLDRPINEEWDFVAGEPPDISQRYFKALEMFKRALEEEEAKLSEHITKEVSELVTWSENSGAIWLHMLLSSGFFDWFSFPCMQLRQRMGVERWRAHMEDLKDTEQVKEFVARKLRELECYDEKVDTVEGYKTLMESGAMRRIEFLDRVRAVLEAN